MQPNELKDILIIALVICTVILLIVIHFQSIMVDSYKKFFLDEDKNNALIRMYCLKKAMQDAIANEDFEIAYKCQEYIKHSEKKVR